MHCVFSLFVVTELHTKCINIRKNKPQKGFIIYCMPATAWHLLTKGCFEGVCWQSRHSHTVAITFVINNVQRSDMLDVLSNCWDWAVVSEEETLDLWKGRPSRLCWFYLFVSIVCLLNGWKCWYRIFKKTYLKLHYKKGNVRYYSNSYGGKVCQYFWLLIFNSKCK